MAELLTNFKDLATDERFIQDTREIIMNKLFMENTEDFFTIVPGIKGGQQVAAMKDFEYVTVKSAGCGGAGINPAFPAFSQSWNPQLQEVKVNMCWDEFEGSFLQWSLANGYGRKDFSQTTLALFIQEMLEGAMRKDLLRIVLLGDKDIASQDILTDEATMVKYYNTIDKGLIPTLQYLSTLPEFADQFVEITKNDGAQTSQYDLPSDYAVGIYEDINATYDFTGDQILSSNRLFLNYKNWIRRGNGYNVQGNIDATVNGVPNTNIDGREIKPIVNYDIWKGRDFLTDITVGEDDDIPHVHIPHFALNTMKQYLQVGVDDVSSLTDITVEYIGGADETVWFKANYMLDFKMVNPYAMRAAL